MRCEMQRYLCSWSLKALVRGQTCNRCCRTQRKGWRAALCRLREMPPATHLQVKFDHVVGLSGMVCWNPMFVVDGEGSTSRRDCRTTISHLSQSSLVPPCTCTRTTQSLRHLFQFLHLHTTRCKKLPYQSHNKPNSNPLPRCSCTLPSV
jgi:hypothetical protein